MLAETPDQRSGSSVSWYSYAIVRVVPRVERGEYLNVGVILFARTLGFLQARIEFDENRFRVLAPDADLAAIQRHLAAVQAICSGAPDRGPIAVLPPSERFHWLTSPRSTVVQTSPIHVGCCKDPEAAIEELMYAFVRPVHPG